MSIFDGNGSNTLTEGGGEGESEFFKLIRLSSSKSSPGGLQVVLTGSAGTNCWTAGLPVSNTHMFFPL